MRIALLLALTACAPDEGSASFTPLDVEGSEKASSRALTARVVALEAQNTELLTRLAAVEAGLQDNTDADSRAQDYNSSRSNKTATAVDLLTDALAGESLISALDTDADDEYDTFAGTGAVEALGVLIQDNTDADSRAQDYNSSRSNKSNTAIDDLTDALVGESVVSALDADGDGDYDTFSGTGALDTRVSQVEDTLVLLGILDVDAVGGVVEGSAMRDFVVGVGESLDGLYAFFEGWPSFVDPWATEACTSNSRSAECAALTETAAAASESSTGMADGRANYTPLTTELGEDEEGL